MSDYVRFSCYLLGARSLIIQCGDKLLDRGHDVRGVISDDPEVISWALDKNLPVATTNDAVATIVGNEFDYLFSVVNQKVTPAGVINAAKIAAINFHDGPLPQYAGMNTTTWALMNGEQQHAVTWHSMRNSEGRSEIYEQTRFDIAPEETSFTLDVKCFELAFDSFLKVLDKIEQGALQGEELDLAEVNVCRRSDRPENGAWVDWSQTAQEVVKLVRALNHGTYENPVATPRAMISGRSVIIAQAEVSEDSGTAGQVLSADSNGLKVATGSASITITELLDNHTGQAVDLSGFAADDQFQVLSESNKASLADIVSRVATKEPAWLKRFAAINEFDSPIRLAGEFPSANGSELVDLNIDSQVSGCTAHTLVGLLAAFWARLGKSDVVDLPFQIGAVAEDAMVASGFSHVLPLTVDLTDDPDAAALESQLSAQVAQLENAVTYTTDLFVRYPQFASLPKHWVTQQHAIAFVVCEGAADQTQLPAIFNVVYDKQADSLSWLYNASVVKSADVEQYLEQFKAFAAAVLEGASPRKATLLTAKDRALLKEWNQTDVEFEDVCVHQLIEQQALDNPDAPALACGSAQLTYAELNQKANQVARCLVAKGVGIGDRVGILMDRSESMVIAMIAAWKAGGSYVPLDPTYPVDRIQYMIDDSHLAAIVSQSEYRSRFEAHESVAWIDFAAEQASMDSQESGNLDLSVATSELAYTIYTSGSTGKPKGVMVEHRNAVNFFVGMDDRIECAEPGTWLAVTSISFDISVLELFWSLSRGFKVVLYQDEKKALAAASKNAGMDFGLFYWNVASEIQENEKDKYRLLLESAKYGDENGFKAVWTPERHFAAFGALFPNPAVTSAAIATITKNVEIRAGSCVAPLHSPIRIAEDWSVIDNLSDGRVGIAFASGWAPKDFAIKPETFPTAKTTMFEYMDTVRDLWKGETKTFQGGKGEVEVFTLPRPIQKELPVWVTTAGNIDSYIQAAEYGAGILTHLLGQTVEEVGEKVAAYRKRWKECGHPGEGNVVVMLHTLIGPSEEAVEKIAREPMKEYLKSAMFLVKQAAWNFPVYKQMSEEQGKTLDELFETLSDQDYDQVLDFAFERYYGTSGLFGTPDSALEMVKAVKKAGANEIGCLIDFGMDTDVVLEHLPYLKELLDKAKNIVVEVEEDNSPDSIEKQFGDHDVTHFQCTPSMATMLVNEPSMQPHLQKLKQMMVGGEAMPPKLAREMAQAVTNGRVTNMYGPTETTIWSSTQDVGNTGDIVPIGKPIANTQIFILDEHDQPLPIGAVGEIVICGKGVVRGYHERPELNEERFITLEIEGETYRAYRTGDLGKWMDDGVLQCLGRQDHQVKIRGYRIELGEIESLLREHPQVLEAAVDVLTERQQLAAFYRTAPGGAPTSKELEDFLSAKLPEFMVPAFYKELKVIPQTPNGKIDRKALPKNQLTDSGVESQAEFVAPTNELEKQVAEIWKGALGVSSVGINDNFFDIGGHSILALQVLQEFRKITDKSLQMTDLFKYTTISAIAKFLASDESESEENSKLKSRGAARKAAMNKRRVRRR